MELVFIILALAFWLAPLVVAVIALVIAQQTRKEIQLLRPSRSTEPTGNAVPDAQPPVTPDAPLASTPPPLPPRPPPVVATKPTPREGLEFLLGGKAASFAGIAIIVVGIVLFVGYAIQHAWIGPGLRVLLGLGAGGALVVAGHLAEIRSTRLRILARALTGGGAALFYFSVFAAHGIYGLIGPLPAGLALAACAATTFALAALYRSQAVALLGFAGAVLTPLLLQGRFDRGLFPMLYLTAVNVPVIVLGHRRQWQVLFNMAAVASVLLVAAWVDREVTQHAGWAYGMVGVVYLQFAALSLMRLHAVRTETSRSVDLVRQALLGLALLGAYHWIPREAGHAAWRGAIFIGAAIASVGLAVIAQRSIRALRDEGLGFLLVALTFASLALPVQLDGAWVSLGWGLEGVLLCAFALRLRSPVLQSVAAGLALLGLAKSIGYDFTLFDTTPDPFLNSRFAVGLISAALLFLQGYLHARAPREPDARTVGGYPASEWIRAAGLLAFVAVPMADLIVTAGLMDRMAWWLGAALAGAGAAFAVWTLRPGTPGFTLGIVLLGLLPIVLVLETFSVPSLRGFSGPTWGLQLLLIAAALACAIRRAPATPATCAAAPAMYLTASLSALLIVSREIHTLPTAWAGSLLTIVWALAACAFVGVGLIRRAAYLRYAGLALFGVTVGKVFLVDLADLRGLERIAAFLAAGVLLLGISFVYQRLAPRWTGRGDAS